MIAAELVCTLSGSRDGVDNGAAQTSLLQGSHTGDSRPSWRAHLGEWRRDGVILVAINTHAVVVCINPSVSPLAGYNATAYLVLQLAR